MADTNGIINGVGKTVQTSETMTTPQVKGFNAPDYEEARGRSVLSHQRAFTSAADMTQQSVQLMSSIDASQKQLVTIASSIDSTLRAQLDLTKNAISTAGVDTTNQVNSLLSGTNAVSDVKMPAETITQPMVTPASFADTSKFNVVDAKKDINELIYEEVKILREYIVDEEAFVKGMEANGSNVPGFGLLGNLATGLVGRMVTGPLGKLLGKRAPAAAGVGGKALARTTTATAGKVGAQTGGKALAQTGAKTGGRLLGAAAAPILGAVFGAANSERHFGKESGDLTGGERVSSALAGAATFGIAGLVDDIFGTNLEGGVAQTIHGFGNLVAETGESMFNGAMTAVETFGNAAKSYGEGIGAALEGMGAPVEAFFSGISTNLDSVFNGLEDGVKSIGDAASNLVTAGTVGLASIANETLSGINTFADNAGKHFNDLAKTLTGQQAEGSDVNKEFLMTTFLPALAKAIESKQVPTFVPQRSASSAPVAG